VAGKRSRRTYTVANTGSTILARLQGVDEGHNNARSRVANGVAESDSTTESRVRSGQTDFAK